MFERRNENGEDSPNAGRFLEHFRSIERILGRAWQDDSDRFDAIGFKRLVRDADVLSKEMKDDLEEFADLRNAIVHRSRKRPIADPNNWVVERIAEIAAFLADPPRIKFSKSITMEPSAPVRDAMELMRRESFSQIPICTDGVFAGLLTTDCIARWLAGAAARNRPVSFSTPVGEVLSYAGDENHAFLRRNAPQIDVIRLFNDWTRQGRRLHAVLITQNGHPSEGLLGILTVWDLPEIYRELTGNSPGAEGRIG